MNITTFTAEVRKMGIKNASKKALLNNQIVGVVYNHKENTPIQFNRHDFEKLIPHIRSNTLLTIKLGSQKKSVYIKDYSFFLKNHRIQHIDFQEIIPGRQIKIYVPIEYIGMPVGVVKGGFTQIISKSVHVKCDSENIPKIIKIDISGLDLNQKIYLKDAPQLAGVKYLESLDLALVGVMVSSRRKSEGAGEQTTEEKAKEESQVAEEK